MIGQQCFGIQGIVEFQNLRIYQLFLRFILGGAAAFLPSSNGGKMRSRPNRPDQDPLGTTNKQRASR